jgi:hypothetical protein
MRIRGVGDSRGLPAITVDSGNELVILDRAIDNQLWCLLGGEMSHPGNQLHAHVVRVLLVAMELLRANHAIVRTEEK